MSTNARGLILFTIASTAGAVLLLWMLYLVRDQLMIVYVSALLATGLAPLVRVIERQKVVAIGGKRLPRAAAILVIYALFLAVVGGVLAAAVPPVVAQAEQLWQDLPTKLDALQGQLVRLGLLPATFTIKEILSQSPSGSANAVGTVLSAVWSILGGLLGFSSILLLTFYLLVEWHGILNVFIRLFPREHRQRVAEVSSRVAVKISAWLGGQLLLGLSAVVVIVALAIGTELLGIVGVLLAVPTAAIVQVLVEELLIEPAGEPA